MYNIKKIFINTIAPLAIFLIISIVYMAPALSGKNISQHDIMQHKGQAKELIDHRNETGEEGLWTNSMFGGMPAYMISTYYPSNLLKMVHSTILLGNWRPICFLFLYCLGFYLSLLAFKVNNWLSIIGALAYAFSSYLIIIIVAGHNSKVLALGYLPAIIGGIHLAFRGKYLWGGLLAGIALGIQILVIHLQITYYTLIIVLIYGLFEFIWAYKQGRLQQSLKALGVLVIAVLLAIGSNMSNLLTTIEYGEYTIRGKSELTLNAENKTSGLDRDYATAWSYGISESFTLLIPNFMGGASYGELPQNSETYKYLSKVQGKATAKKAIKQMPTYWGDVIVTSGPVYVGAIICFLFVLGLFIVDRKLRWWLLSATIISLVLAWGRNVPNITYFLLDHLPGYNKFRAVSMTLVIAGFTMPLLGILALDKVFKNELDKKEVFKALKYAFGITGGLLLFFILFAKGLFSFEALSDQRYLAQDKGYADLIDAFQADRAMLLKKDAIRSLIFVSLAASLIFFYVKGKLKLMNAILAIGVLILLDMWPIAKRYLNKDHFITQKKYEKPFTPSKADNYILQDKSLDYRVLNLSTSPFQDAATSYYHKSIGGYHGAKMRRYQEIIEYHISPEIQKIGGAMQTQDMNQINEAIASCNALNILNTKYIILNPEAQPIVNNSINGNAWLLSNYRIVEDSDEEIVALREINIKENATIDKRYSEFVENKTYKKDSLAKISLVEYQPNYLKYESSSTSDQLAVFSEIYYPKGWNATIDGEPVDHFRANYVLRAMSVPAGEHTIEFSFKPKSYYIGEKISLASSLIFLLIFIGVIGLEVKKAIAKKE